MNALFSLLMLFVLADSSYAALSHQSLDKLRLIPDITIGAVL